MVNLNACIIEFKKVGLKEHIKYYIWDGLISLRNDDLGNGWCKSYPFATEFFLTSVLHIEDQLWIKTKAMKAPTNYELLSFFPGCDSIPNNDDGWMCFFIG